jgi:hypothetical protein
VTPLALALLAAAAAATPSASASAPGAAPSFDVGGGVSLTEDGELEVRVDLMNRGGTASGAVTVVGELAGHYDEAQVPAGVAAGATSAARLVFPREVPRPGVYPVVLLLDYAPAAAPGVAPAAAGVAPAARSQRAFLLLTLGATAAVPVRISAPEITLRDRALLPVDLESADGRAHRIRLRVLTPRGLNAERLQDEVAVPATGVARVSVPLLRGGVARPSRQGLLLVAETLDGDVAQASTSTSVVTVAAAVDLMPRWRDPFVVAAGLLLAAAAVLEWRHLRQLRRASADPAA